MYTDYSILQQHSEEDIIIHIIQMKKLIHREIKKLAKRHQATVAEPDDPNSVMSVEKCPHFFNIVLCLTAITIIIVDI